MIPEEYNTIAEWLQGIAHGLNNPMNTYMTLIDNWGKLTSAGKATIKADVLETIDTAIASLTDIRTEIDSR